MPNPITPGFEAQRQEQLRLDRQLKDAGHRFGVHSNVLQKVATKENLEAELRQYFNLMMNKAAANNDQAAWKQLSDFMRSMCEQDEKLNQEMEQILGTGDFEQRKAQLRNLLQNQHFLAQCVKALYPLYLKNPNLSEVFANALKSPLEDVMEDYDQCSRQAGYSGAESRIGKQLMNIILSVMFAFANLCSVKFGNGPFDFKLDGSPVHNDGEEGKQEKERVRIIHR